MPVPRAAGRRIAAGCALIAGLLLASATRVAAAAPSQALSFTSDEWLAACDELLDCRLLGFARGDAQPVLSLDKPRSGTTRGTVLLPPAAATGATTAMRLVLPRRPDPVTATLRPGRAADDPAPSSRGALSTPETTAVLAVLRGGGRIAFLPAGSPRSSRPLATLRLSGAPAALDWIAERQRHLPEQPPPSPTPPVFDGPRPDAAHPPAAVSTLPEAAGCARDADPDSPGATDLSAWRLGPAETLWALPCGSDNFTRTTLFVLDGPGGARPVAFPDLPDAPHAAVGTLANAVVDPDGRRIEAVDLARGLGDCGRSRGFRWDGSGFRLVSARLMPLCRGLPVRDWPVVYRGPD